MGIRVEEVAGDHLGAMGEQGRINRLSGNGGEGCSRFVGLKANVVPADHGRAANGTPPSLMLSLGNIGIGTVFSTITPSAASGPRLSGLI